MTVRRAWRHATAAAALFAAACGGSAPESQSSSAAHAAPVQVAHAAEATPITVYKTPTCGCCKKWVEHLEKNGFRVTVEDMDDVSPVKAQHGVPGDLHSCHTGVVDGYVVEGHVPADVIRKLLAERPQVAGIAVPGMPMGSPGMEGPYTEHYDVLAFTEDGKRSVYAKR
jgi:hypothetical protein